MLGYPPTPPPPARGPWRPTGRPTYLLGLGQRRVGGGTPPPFQSLKWFNTPRGHIPPGSHPCDHTTAGEESLIHLEYVSDPSDGMNNCNHHFRHFWSHFSCFQV